MSVNRTAVATITLILGIVACGGEESDIAGSAPEPTTAGDTREGIMKLTSPAFEDQDDIPVEFTCDGSDVSPPLRIDDLPAATETLVLIVDDPDAPAGTWDHWVAFDIPPTTEIPRDVGSLGTSGRNSWGRTGYGGPCPPSGTHRYIHRVYALDIQLGLAEGSDKTKVLAAMEGHVLDEAILTGLYSR